MKPLFIFGTLRHRPLLEAVIGCSDHLDLHSSTLPGYRTHAANEGPFPMIVQDQGAVAEGLCVNGLRPEDRRRMDFFEAGFSYHLKDVVLGDGRMAQSYFPQTGQWTPGPPWLLEDWAQNWGELSVLSAQEIMTYLDVKSPQEVATMFPMIRARAWSRLNAQHSRHGAGTLQGRIVVSERSRPYVEYFAVDEYQLRHTRFDGAMSSSMKRAVFLSPDAALVLPYDPVRDRVLLVEQMRMGPLARGDTSIWQLETIAGRLDAGEAPQDAARREALEEAGLEMSVLHPVAETYSSPGNSSEFYYVFVGLADLPDMATRIGGLADEDEDIRSHVLEFQTLLDMCDDQKIANTPLVMACWWLARHRDNLRKAAGVAEG